MRRLTRMRTLRTLIQTVLESQQSWQKLTSSVMQVSSTTQYRDSGYLGGLVLFKEGRILRHDLSSSLDPASSLQGSRPHDDHTILTKSPDYN